MKIEIKADVVNVYSGDFQREEVGSVAKTSSGSLKFDEKTQIVMPRMPPVEMLKEVAENESTNQDWLEGIYYSFVCAADKHFGS